MVMVMVMEMWLLLANSTIQRPIELWAVPNYMTTYSYNIEINILVKEEADCHY